MSSVDHMSMEPRNFPAWVTLIVIQCNGVFLLKEKKERTGEKKLDYQSFISLIIDCSVQYKNITINKFNLYENKTKKKKEVSNFI